MTSKETGPKNFTKGRHVEGCTLPRRFFFPGSATWDDFSSNSFMMWNMIWTLGEIEVDPFKSDVDMLSADVD